MYRLAFAAVAAATLALAGSANAQQPDFSKVEIKTTDLGHNTYMLEGMGGNITVAVGDDGIIVVDGEFAPLHDKIKAAIEAVSKQPIKYLINTHFHGDHTGGNGPFSKDGAVIVAQDNVAKRLAAGTTNGLTGNKTPPAAPEVIPTKTYKSGSLTIKVKGRTALLRHIDNAHTDGDTYVYFKDANVLSTGDIFTRNYPNIDFANGGNIKGMIAGANTYLKVANDNTKIVPGHGPLATKADLAAYRDMLVTAQDRIAKLVKDGKTEDEVLAAKPLADLDAKWAANDQSAKNFVRVVYNSLKPPKPAA